MEQMIQIKNISEIKKYISNLRAVIFDLDDTLYPLNEYVKSGFRQISRLFLGHSQEVYDQLWNAYERQATMKVVAADDIAGHGDVTKFRKPNPICFEIMRLRLDVDEEQMGYVGILK